VKKLEEDIRRRRVALGHISKHTDVKMYALYFKVHYIAKGQIIDTQMGFKKKGSKNNNSCHKSEIGLKKVNDSSKRLILSLQYQIIFFLIITSGCKVIYHNILLYFCAQGPCINDAKSFL